MSEQNLFFLFWSAQNEDYHLDPNFFFLDSVSTVKTFFLILEVQLYKIWNIATSGFLSVKKASKALVHTKRFVIVDVAVVCRAEGERREGTEALDHCG